jgi:Bifunctional DNA primase/polymerase, N-terminal
MTAGANGHAPSFWAATELAKAGYGVFPVRDKAPSVEGGFYAATTDVSQVAEWIAEGREHHEAAFATGIVSGVVVIDADTPEAYAKMEEEYGEPHVKTGRGGHWYFGHPRKGKIPSGPLAEGLDRKGDGGYVVAPPSRGRTWTNGIPDREALPVLPPELGEKPKPRKDGGRAATPEEHGRAVEAISRHVAGIPQGNRHEHLKHLCGVLLSRGVAFEDAGHILIAAWSKVGEDLAQRGETEVPNTLRTTEQALAEGRATGVPSMEEITPGLYEELEDIFGWAGSVTLGKRSKAPELLPWPELDGTALYGLAGDVVRTFDPHTEADPVAVLANLLCAFGNVIGRGAFARVGTTEHHLKLFVGLVGETAKGRKGESWTPVRALTEVIDPGWVQDRVMSGLSSGEGLIHAVRDEMRGIRKDEEVVLDPWGVRQATARAGGRASRPLEGHGARREHAICHDPPGMGHRPVEDTYEELPD